MGGPGKNPFMLVFSNKYCLVIGVSVAILFWILLNLLDQLLFFWPGLIFYLPGEKLFSFAISTITSAALGVVIPMNIYSIAIASKRQKSKVDSTSLLSGTSFAIASCACAGCSSVGLALLPAFGSIGAIGIAFFAQYQEVFRTISFGILLWSMTSIYQKLKNSISI